MTDQKISEFNLSTSLNDSDLFTFVVNGTNKNISFANLKADLGVTGTLVADGASGSTQILETVSPNNYKIRNIEDGAGILSAESPENGITLTWNVSQDATASSFPIVSSVTAAKPVFASFTGGDNVNLIKTGNNIVISAHEAEQKKISGFIDYNDVATATAPISIPNTNTFTKLTNDGLGSFTNKTYKPEDVTELWNVSTNQLDFSGLSLGDQVDIRIDLEVTTTSANQEFDIEIKLGVGGTPYTLPVRTVYRKTASTKSIVPYFGFYMGDANTIDNIGEIGVKSDTSCTVKVNGWYIRVIKYNA